MLSFLGLPVLCQDSQGWLCLSPFLLSDNLGTKPRPLARGVSCLWLVWPSPRVPIPSHPSLGLHHLVTGSPLCWLVSHLHSFRTRACLASLSDLTVRPQSAPVWDSATCGHMSWYLLSLGHSSTPISPDLGHPRPAHPHMGAQTQIIPPICAAFPKHFHKQHLPCLPMVMIHLSPQAGQG